jgi:hypothetical protein
MPGELLELAMCSARDAFVEKSPFFLLYGEAILLRRPRGSGAMEDTDRGPWDGGTDVSIPKGGESPARVVLAVRKLHPGSPSMITVGRASKNDIVLVDASISKSHAFFRLVETGVELDDAGSLAGTWLNDERLSWKSRPARVKTGDVIRFAHHKFHFLDAGACWDRIRAAYP